jgi:protein MAK16
MTKITQYLIRMRRLRLKTRPKLEGVKKKLDRREARREQKAEAAARLEMSIEKELLERLKKGVYNDPDAIANVDQESFAKALDRIEEMDGAEVDFDEDELEEDEEEMEEEYEDGEMDYDEDEDEEVRCVVFRGSSLPFLIQMTFICST